jgi:hypothetical protein
MACESRTFKLSVRRSPALPSLIFNVLATKDILVLLAFGVLDVLFSASSPALQLASTAAQTALQITIFELYYIDSNLVYLEVF